MKASEKELKELEVAEVSLVDRAANRWKFILLKNAGGIMNEVILNVSTDEDAEVLKAVAADKGGLLKLLRAVTKSDEKVSASLAKAGLSGEAADAVKTALKALEAVKSQLPADIIKTLSEMAGYKYPEDAKPEAKADPAKPEDEMDGVMKADGTLDADKIPAAIRPVVEMLWKQNRDNAEALAKSESVLKQEREDRKMREYIAKASGFKHLSIDAAKFGPVLKSASDSMPVEMYTELERVISAADAGLAPLFKEAGIDRGAEGKDASAHDQLMRKAEDIRKSHNGKISIEQAFTKALDDFPDLAAKERSEREGRAH